VDLSRYRLDVVREDADLILYRGYPEEGGASILMLAPNPRQVTSTYLQQLEHEHSLAEELKSEWAIRPFALLRHERRTALLFDDPGGLPLASSTGTPMEVSRCLSIALAATEAIRQVHQRGLIHRNIKPGNVFVDEFGRVRLTGFGFATRLSRERQALVSPELLPGTLTYMAPERSGRVNRSVDARSDLYSLGVTLYEMLTGAPPFVTVDPLEMIHCHVARRPPPPSEKVAGIPPVIESIVTKLLEKNAEDRYQTAAGVEFDLNRCLIALSNAQPLEAFDLGERDTAEQLRIPERLYGRDDEFAVLLRAFDYVATGGCDYLVVSGPSGIGKSSLVQELRRAPITRRALFAEGRCDRFKPDIPYKCIAEAIRGLLKQILMQDEIELERWRMSLSQALGSLGRLMLDLIPELGHMIGEQPELQSVSHEEERQRLFPVFRRLLTEFARPEHPLVLFLDDLQWLDAATLELLDQLALNPEIPGLLLIGAYRTGDAAPNQSRARILSTINPQGRAAREMVLGPLTVTDIEGLIADTLRTDASSAQPLAQLVHQETKGNGFFIRQFLTELHAEGLLRFDPGLGEWQWDLASILSKTHSENVSAVIAAKLARAGKETREALTLLACLGTRAQAATLAKVLGITEEAVHRTLLELGGDDLLHRSGSEYAFAHDRVREAAYSLLTDEERPLRHLNTARALVDGLTRKALEESVFEILNHYRHGLALMDAPSEKAHVAELNLIAGRRARAAAAYESALSYFADGCALLETSSWELNHEVAFALEFHQADCRFILGDVAFAESRLAALALRCRSQTDRVLVVGRQMILYLHRGESEEALALVVGCLQDLGESLPLDPTDYDVEEAYQELLSIIGDRTIESLVHLPIMTDAASRAVTDLLEALTGPAGSYRLNLITLAQLRIARLCVEHGVSDGAAHAFAGLGRVVGWSFGELETGQRFGRLALRLVDERGLDRFAERVYSVVAAFIAPYTMRLRECGELALRAAEMGPERGGLSFTGYSWSLVTSFLFDSGAPLAEVQRRAEAALAAVRERKFIIALQMITIPLLIVRALRGLTPSLGSAISSDEDAEFVRILTSESKFSHNVPRFMIRQLQLRYYAGNYAGCLEAIKVVQAGLFFPLYEKVCEFWFFSALTYAAVLSESRTALPEEHWLALLEAHGKLNIWAERCAVNFADRARLVAAEVARLKGDVAGASALYEEAIRLARENGFLQNQGIANELAARFYEHQGLIAIRDAYARSARSCYLRWGADGKVRDLDQIYPHLTEEAVPRSNSELDTRTQIQNVEFGAVIDMHQAVAGEIVFNRLIERLMVTVVEHAGAVRGLVLLPQDGEMHVVAEAVTGRNSVTVHLRHQAAPAGELPQSVLNYVVRTQDYVIVDDALKSRVHSADEYVRRVRPRAILCLPLVKQKRLVGILYLENTLSSHVFTAERLSVLQLLASQAAISIENANLFRDVQRAQESARRVGEELRRSFDMIPALAWRASPDGSFEFANRQWHEYTGISSDDALCGTWIRAFHPDDEEKVEGVWRKALEAGSAGEVEARMQRFDGEIRSFLVRVTPVRDDLGKVVTWHGTHTDIENLKRAEQAQEALARVSRITAMGELTVSITHEVSQPLMAIEMNAVSCLRWLDEEQLDVTKARQAAERIIRDGQRAREVIASMRMLTRKAAHETSEVDINEVIAEAMTLTRNELERHGISAELVLAADVAATRGVRVQIQQVILNLVINAIEAMVGGEEAERVLHISSAGDGADQVRVNVADSGSGLDPANRERAFEAFFTTKSEGLGLGLSICRSIIEAHGGRLWAAPNVPRGSVFSFTLPLAKVGVGHPADKP
jgi:PAS domain S-box-containing protein